MSSYLSPERRRWFIVAIIFVAIVFNYFDRQIVSILKPVLKEEFKLDDAGYAVIVNVFTVCYALMYPVTGWLVDRFGAKLVMFFWYCGLVFSLFGWGDIQDSGAIYIFQRHARYGRTN